jgi:cytoskeletal protein CcmA (bactofilin family)
VKPAERQSPRELARSILGSDVLVIGDITGEGALEVAGRVQGNIKVTGSVRIIAGGSIVGDIHADSVEIGGNVRGNLTARAAIEIMGTAEVEGNLVAPRVGIETGAQVVGTIATGAKPSGRPVVPERTPKAANRPEIASTGRASSTGCTSSTGRAGSLGYASDRRVSSRDGRARRNV